MPRDDVSSFTVSQRPRPESPTPVASSSSSFYDVVVQQQQHQPEQLVPSFFFLTSSCIHVLYVRICMYTCCQEKSADTKEKKVNFLGELFEFISSRLRDTHKSRNRYLMIACATSRKREKTPKKSTCVCVFPLS